MIVSFQKAKKRIRIGNLPNGSLFIYNNTIAIKSEYCKDNGEADCYIIGTGEYFCDVDLNNLLVYKLNQR